MKFKITVFALIFGVCSCLAQAPLFDYVFNAGGGGTTNATGHSIARDGAGNIVVIGIYEGSIDLDPSGGVANHSSAGMHDIFVVKYNAAGQYIWSIAVGGSGDDFGDCVSIDSNGNLYITGFYSSTVDFDPSVSNANLTSAGSNDIFLAKYNSNGQYQWAHSFGSSGGDRGHRVHIDATNSVYLTGYFVGTADFDPSVATANLSAVGSYDGFLAKFNSAGAYQWAFSYGSAGGDWGGGLCTDVSGNVYLSGNFSGTADFDPSGGAANLTPGNINDLFVAKYNSSGQYQWAFNSGSTIAASAYSLKTDLSGNVYVTASLYGTGDFDPGSSVVNLTSTPASYDLVVAKYNNAGQYQWAFIVGANSGTDAANDIFVDASSNIYIAGYFTGTVDFDPGTGTANVIGTGTPNELFLAKYNSAGQYQWAFGVSSANESMGYGVWVDPSDNVYATGFFGGTADFDPSGSSSNSTSSAGGAKDFVFAKYIQCVPPPAPFDATPSANLGVCSGTTTTLSATGSGIINWYASATSSSVLSTGSSYVTPVENVTVTSTFTYYAEDITCDTSSRTPITYTVNPLPIISITGDSFTCSGGSVLLTASGAGSFSWSTGALTNTVTVSPTLPTTYTVTGTDLNNCSNTQIHFINTTTVPVPEICMVTVDSTSQNNLIIWDKTLYPEADTFYIYRDTANSAYGLIGKVAYADLSLFADTLRTLYAANGDPSASSWRYKLAIRDTCGNLGPKGNYHQSIFMQNNNGNFTWTEYKIEGQVIPVPSLSNYLFKRDDNATGAWNTIQTLSASSTAYTDPNYAMFQSTADWRVETVWSISCTATAKQGGNGVMGAIVKSKSNITNNRLLGIAGTGRLHFGMYPTPAANSVTIVTKAGASIEILNSLGQVVMTGNLSAQTNKLDISGLVNGVYHVKLFDNTGYAMKKLLVQR